MPRSPIALSRRQLLQACGLGATSAFLPSLLGKSASANDSPVRRIVIMTSPHQVMEGTGAMRRSNPAKSAFEYSLADVPSSEFSTILAPLASFKDRLLLVEGLSQVSGIRNDGFSNNHDASHANLLTCAGLAPDDDKASLGPSVDQVIARAIALPDRIPSLEVGDRGYNGGYSNLAAGERAPIETSLSSTFERLFPRPTEAVPDEATVIKNARPSVLDFVREEYAAVAPRLAGEDRRKLERHGDLVRDLERRISGIQGLECSAPDTDLSADGRLRRAEAFADIIGAAFACDVTRVATLQVAQLHNEEFDAPPGDVHQDYAHQSGKNDAAFAEMTKYNVKYAEVFAHLVDTIAAYSDSQGSLLDSTLVIWCPEHGLTDGAHSMHETAFFMAGNVGSHFRTGRYLSLPRRTLHPRKDEDELLGVPHSHFWVSVMQAMGLTDDFIGMRSHVTKKGVEIPLTGPLDALT